MAVDFTVDDTISDLERGAGCKTPSGQRWPGYVFWSILRRSIRAIFGGIGGLGLASIPSLRLPAGRVDPRQKPSPRARPRCAGPSSAGGSSWSTTFFMVRRWPMGIPGKAPAGWVDRAVAVAMGELGRESEV